MHRIVALALAAASLATADLPKFDQVSNGYKEVVSTADGSRPLYRIWKKDNNLLAIAPGLGTTAAHHCGHAKPWHHLRRTARPRSAGVLETQW